MSFRHETRAEVIADSLGPDGQRLITMEITFHRFILAEVNTHRKLSRNSASSRAIPLETMLERAIHFPAIPVEWPREQRGMSGGAELEGADLEDAQDTLARIREITTGILGAYVERHPDKSTRLHKSLLNRPLEWFMWHTAIVSSTEWDNLFKQRIDPAAQPEFHKLARRMHDAIEKSRPTRLENGDWHLPYTNLQERSTLDILELVKISTARCARVSYLTHDGQRDTSEDIRMFNSTLWENGHWSPMEHPAMCVPAEFPVVQSNFDTGWAQLRGFAMYDNIDMLPAIITSLRVHDGRPVPKEELRRSAAILAEMTEEELTEAERAIAEEVIDS